MTRVPSMLSMLAAAAPEREASTDTSSARRRPIMSSIALVVVAFVAVLGASTGAVAADRPAQAQDDPAQALAERFAPILMLKQQDEDCGTEGEPYLPVPIDIVLDNPEVVLRQVGRSDPVVQRGPSAADLHGLGEGFFLDFPGSSLSPGCIFERDARKYLGDLAPTIYAHVVQQPDEPDLVFVQYWFYWYYNDWNNKHESDWEGITLKFEAASVEEALASTPVAVGYSQHEGGERADWDDGKLTREGDRPVVYPSAGSHASYFGSALYLGRSGGEGFGCDNTDGPSTRIDPAVVLLPDSVTDPDDPLAWLAFEGRWGERQEGPFNGPTGPAVKDRWLEPAPWFEELRSASVVVPGGDTEVASLIGVFCDVVESGSGALIAFTVSPTRVVIGIGIVVGLALFVIRRTDWTLVPPTPIRRRRRAGQIIRAAIRSYASAPLSFVMFGVVYIPAAVLAGLFTRVAQSLPLIGDLMALAGSSSGTGVVVSLLVGSAANIGAFILANAMVADYLGQDERSTGAALASMRETWRRRSDLIGAFVRSFVIVAALLLSIVGIPWGIRQIVRYQFLAQTVMVEDRSGRASLARSSDLVKGRWFHTAIVTIALNGLVVISGVIVGLLLLVLVTRIPLWQFSVLLSLVSAVIVPLAAIALTLLYGDADAEHAEQAGSPAAEPATDDPVAVG